MSFGGILKHLLTRITHRVYHMPIVILMPHSRCNCRCVMCDIWKANHERREISEELLSKHVTSFVSLGVREVVFSGGEALLHSNLWRLCSILRKRKIRITILSTGLLLSRFAEEIVSHSDGVIISIDGSEEVHDRIRRIPRGYQSIREGIAALKKLRADFPVTARCVLQRYNYFDFENIVKSGKALGIDQISFLAVDVSTSAFNRSSPWGHSRISEVALDKREAIEFGFILEQSFVKLADEYRDRFIAESPTRMKRIAQYHKALNGLADFPPVVCNAPWVSTVIESDGSVMPCFFHKPLGNINEQDLSAILNSQRAVSFRKKLDMSADETCKKCVCSLKLNALQAG